LVEIGRVKAKKGSLIMDIKDLWKQNEAFKIYVKRSYNEGYTIEAIILLYHRVYLWMVGTLHAATQGLRLLTEEMDKKRRKVKNEHLKSYDYHFKTLARVLHAMGIYDEELYSGLRKLSNFRDDVMHRFFSRKLSKSRFGKFYQLGMRLNDQALEIFMQYPEILFRSINPLVRTSLLAKLLGEESVKSTEKFSPRLNNKVDKLNEKREAKP